MLLACQHDIGYHDTILSTLLVLAEVALKNR